MRWIDGRPRTRYGYTDLGSIQIPALPQHIGLTDRADGTVWYLTHNIASPGPDGNGYISISDVAPPGSDYVIYAANEGPVLGTNPNLRLLIRGGRIGYEIWIEEPNPNNVQEASPPALTRRGNAEETRLIYKPSWWQQVHLYGAAAKSDELVWTVLSI